MRLSSWWATCCDEVWVFHRVWGRKTWGRDTRQCVMTRQHVVGVGLWKGGGCVVVVVFDASRVGLLTDPESCQCVMMCRHSLLNLLFRCGLVSSKTIK